MDVESRWIWITTSFRGTHCWPECPYEDVKFLRDPHRHTFHVKVYIEVEHHDRELEFFKFQIFVDRAIKKLYGPDRIKQLGRRSCETIADELHNYIATTHNRRMIIEVSEDGEVGARVVYKQHETPKSVKQRKQRRQTKRTKKTTKKASRKRDGKSRRRKK